MSGTVKFLDHQSGSGTYSAIQRKPLGDSNVNRETMGKPARWSSFDFKVSANAQTIRTNDAPSIFNLGMTKVGTKRLISKDLEEKLKETTQKLTVKKLSSIKREKSNSDCEKVYSAFLILFSDIDHTINLKGLKVNPSEVMLSYVSSHSALEKALQKFYFSLKHSKITDSTIYIETLLTSYSIFLNVNQDNLTYCKLLYNFLSVIFESCGYSSKPEDMSIKNIIKSNLPDSKTLDLAKSALEIIKTPSKGSNQFSTKNAEVCNDFTKTLDERNENGFQDAEFLHITVSRPPRISQRYLEAKRSKTSRSLSVNSLRFKQICIDKTIL